MAETNLTPQAQAQKERGAYLEHLDGEVAAHPRWPDLKLQLAMLRDEDGEDAAARELLDQALEINPRYLDAQIARAAILGREDPAAADRELAWVRELAKNAATEPGAARAALMAAQVLRGLGRKDDALALLPADPPVCASRHPILFLRTRLLADLGLSAGEAERAWEKALAEHADLRLGLQLGGFLDGLPPRGTGLRKIVLYLAEQDELDRSKTWQQQALGADLNLAAHGELTGEIHFALGAIEEAVEVFEAALRIAPEYARTRVSCAYALGVADRSDQALAHLREAVARYPHYADLHYELATLLSDRGDGAAAVQHLETAIGINPRYLDALYALGVLRASAGDDRGAAEVLVCAYEAGLDHEELRIELGLAWLALGEVERAREVLDPLRDDDPDNMEPAGCLAFGLLEHQSGDVAGAQGWLDRFRATEQEFGGAALAGSNRRLSGRVDALQALLQRS